MTERTPCACGKCGKTVSLSDGMFPFVCKCGHRFYSRADMESGIGKEPVRNGEEIKRDYPMGPGTHLKRILSYYGIQDTGGCGCDSKAAKMDRLGPDWCEQNIEKIIGWLRGSAKKRGMSWLFVTPIVRMMVNQAIQAARDGDWKLKPEHVCPETPVQVIARLMLDGASFDQDWENVRQAKAAVEAEKRVVK